jgi:sugar transferase (PEP-CTERM/EpsH1 system associated)
MRILFLNAELPYPPRGGSKIRVYHLLRHLVQRHEATLFGFTYGDFEEPAVEALQDLCRVVAVPWREPSVYRAMRESGAWGARFWYWRHLLLSPTPFIVSFFDLPEAHACVADLLAEEVFDVIHAETTYMAQFLPRRKRTARHVVGLQNVEWLRHRRGAERATGLFSRLIGRWEARKMRRWEARALCRADLVCTVSTPEAALVHSLAPRTRVCCVPNGVDTSEFTPRLNRESPQPHLVFVGTLSYPPNAEAVLHFCRHIMPLIRAAIPDVHLTVVGQQPPPEVRALAGTGITVTGTVPDVRPYLGAAQVVVPLLQGAGTRLKILEALAMGKAVVSTSIGAEGLDLTHGSELLIADRDEEFARRTVQLLRNPSLRRALGERGRTRVVRDYDWRRIGGMLEAAYQALVAEGGLPPARTAAEMLPELAEVSDG